MNDIIVFNALQTSLSGGIGRYSYELAKNLYIINKDKIKIVIREADLELFKFVDKKDLIIAKKIENSFDRNIYEQFILPIIVKRKYPNAILHYPDSMAPLFGKNRVIITIHDLAFKSLKNVFTWKTVLWKSLVTNLSIKKASSIIAITNFTKEEIIRHYQKIDADKINVIYNGFNNFSKDKIELKNVRMSIKEIKKPYLLTVSTISPRKNIDGLIKSFSKIEDKIEENLVIAGVNGWMYEKVYNIVKELKLEKRIIFTGKVNDDELKFLYKNSKAFAYISFYEGFGLPPLEAMSYGKKCLVSNTSSLPEVVGDSAIKVDPNNLNDISKSIIQILKDNEEVNLNLVNNTKKFSWEKCAYDTFKIYCKN